VIHATATLATTPHQIHRFLLKLRGETPPLLAHEAPPFADYARKVSTKSGEDHIGSKINSFWPKQ